jgi:type IV secretory pathway VirB2 component (pilin)
MVSGTPPIRARKLQYYNDHNFLARRRPAPELACALQRILESIEGPVAKVIAVVIIIVTGLSLAFGMAEACGG